MTATAFEEVERYRAELKAHCYRMLGSAFEAEDAVQEAMVRAWRAADRFEGRTTLRGWLYRIATNVCLSMLARDKHKRLTPYLSSSPASDYPHGPARDVSWLEPYPQAFLDDIPDSAPAPHARYEQKEATELAFVAAIAYLPPRQRAALILHEVLGWSAQETARALETSVASINSALQRARETLRKKLPVEASSLRARDTTEEQHELLGRYVAAWESQDMRALTKLLREDAILSMPPVPEWYQGPDQIAEIFGWGIRQMEFAAWRAVPAAANYQPAIVLYGKDTASDDWHPHAVHVLDVRDGRIAIVNNFMDPAVCALFVP
ncbi:MAG TPA: RNA polymerase subunit sigma-70 [Candidatus Acidoferrales bacterium]|nr:RNA polymerase subunit sigma-70 [Candidatus Acidoferrales bacterium]